MDEEDPIRLKQGPGAPPSLVRALEALRKGTDETARLERVAAKLGPLLDAPAPSTPAKPSVGSASYKLTALKLIVAGLVLLAPVLWMMRRDGSAKPQKDQAPNEVASVAKPPEADATKPAPTLPPKAEPVVPPSGVSAQRPELAPADRDHRDRAEGRGQRADARRVRGGQVEAAPATATSDSTESSADGADGARAAETATEQSARAAEPTPTPAATPSAPQPAAAKADVPSPRPPPSEAQLLFAARKAMPDDPALALRLLADHQRHYPEGVFVPEREVLAIEALRGLGRTAEANARLRVFKARYPHSFHLKRLER